MTYTYRYSREPTVTVSYVCPICCARTVIEQKDSRITTHMLCCSPAHTQEYEKRIHRAIAWCRDQRSSREDIVHSHYNSKSTRNKSIYNTVAQALAHLGEYCPFVK